MENNNRFETTLKELLALLGKQSSNLDINKISEACHFAYEILGETSWESGKPIIYHSMSVARIVATDIGLGTDPVI
ncbi:MAG TPA: hypothetical protein PKJ43_10000, partial [Prolixibacteraceae bacterium]|nr:hypothetical protein [Prolixibacteraceae bacterium]